MKKLIQYETSDGRKFDDIDVATHHENALQLSSILFREGGARMNLTIVHCYDLANIALHHIYINNRGALTILEGDSANEV